MVNNDEQAVYGTSIISRETIKAQGASLVIARPLFQEEVDAGLNLEFHGMLMDENPPEITLWLDALFRLIQGMLHPMDLIPGGAQISPSERLAQFIATNYYDCMSGGCPTHVLAILKNLCEDPRVNLRNPVYPSKESWADIADFLKDVGNANLPKMDPRVLDVIKELPAQQRHMLLEEKTQGVSCAFMA